MTAKDVGLRTAIVDAIVALTADFGYPPTQAELALEVKRGRQPLRRVLAELREAKIVDWTTGSPRSMRVVRMTE